MIVDKSKIGLTFAHPRVKRETQELAIREAGASWIVHVGKDPPDWRAPVRQLRPGDTIYVYACVMLPSPRDDLSKAAQWTAAVRGIHERGATLIEVATGLKSSVPAQWRSMNRETHAAFKKTGMPLPKGIMPKGRRRKTWIDEYTKATALRLWRSKNIPSDAAAIREAKDTLPGITDRLMRSLGPSGRNT